MYVREQYSVLKQRIEEPRRVVQVIAGPRQVGKSTLVKQVLQDINIPYTHENADAISADDSHWIGSLWNTIRQQMQFRKEKEHLLVIDEIHKINNWSEQIKKEWDDDTFNDREIKVVLLGSSRLLLKKGLTESLAGRFELIRMPHWSYKEMHDAFGWDLNQYVYFGGYPGSAAFVSDERRWRRYITNSIIAPSIEKDVIKTSVIYKPALMHNLFELGCAYSGKELSLNKMLGQLQDVGNVTTLSNYLNLLDESHLLGALQKYANDKARKYNSVPKLQVYNTALLSVRSGLSYEQAFTDANQWGRWIETAVGMFLINNAPIYDYKLYYWRESDKEVDFVMERYGEVIAIEVKSGRRANNKGLGIFSTTYTPKHAFIVGSGGIPVEEFLQYDIEMFWK